ncbi:hypothetical protein [Allofournierella massiliensis]|uniref:Uncharacterized protein n=1 Tax=Allofournierella massiliensis TaxID=1650663 RepID=A0ABT7UT13_9FIRM|nr:hypothetical protein [Fournierella massiliensis]MDM8202035.1 hypothetical protein [Fournierella massiliensis]
MENVLLATFGAVLLLMIGLDAFMIISLIRTGDERQKMIVWKTSSFTLLIVVGAFVVDIVESIVKMEAMLVNPFVKLSVTAMTYFIVLLYYKKKYGD